MLEPAAREDGRSTVGVQHPHHLAAAGPAAQTGGAMAPNRRITADSFRALKARLMQGKTAPFPPLQPVRQSIAVSPPEPGFVEVQAPATGFAEIEEVNGQNGFGAASLRLEEPPQPPEPVESELLHQVQPVPPAAIDFWNQIPPLPQAAPEPAAASSQPEAPMGAAPVIREEQSEPPAKSSMEAILSAVFGAGAASWTLPEPEAAEPPKAPPAWTEKISLAPAPQQVPVLPVLAETDDREISTATAALVQEQLTPEPAPQPPDEPAIAASKLEDIPEALIIPEPLLQIEAVVAEALPVTAMEGAAVEAALPGPAETEPVEQLAKAEPAPQAVIAPEQPPAAPEPPEPATADEIVPAPASKRDAAGSILRKRDSSEADPFAQAQTAVTASHLPPVEIGEPDPQAGETARSLLDIMSASAAVSQPQERALAADTLLRLIPRVPEKTLVALAERVAIMETPPPLLVTRLIRDPRADVAGPLLEKAAHIPDRDLITVIGEGELSKLRMIARRRHLSPAMVDALLTTNDPSVLLTLVRNPGAAPSHEAFQVLCDQAKLHPSLQAPLVTRQDTPVPTAFELFWFLPPELRRFVLSRFLTDSENLNRILKIALATGSGDTKSQDALSEPQFPERQRVENLVALLVEGKTDQVIVELTELAQICEANARRIIADVDGEPLTIVLKVMGLSRAKFADALIALQESADATLRKNRSPAELQSIFDSMSFNKARVLLTYWDWAAQKSGPYTQLAA